MSYYVKTDTRKDKFYYIEDDLIDKQEIQNINDMFSANKPFNDIKVILDNIGSGIDLFANGYDPCGCAALIDLLKIQMDIILNLESRLPQVRFNMIEPFDTVIQTEVKLDYVKYIQKYGVPDDGVFLPELLAEFE
jgi:hypothetical protein